MHLRDFLASQPRGTAAELARVLGKPHSIVTRVAADQSWPNRELWARIVAATAGQVTPNDHLPTARDGDDDGRTTPTSTTPAG